MKKKQMLLLLAVGMLFAGSIPVSGEEKNEISYTTTEDCCPAYLEIYEGERLLYKAWSEDDAGVWYMYTIEDEEGREYLWAKSVGDNDFCSDVILLEYMQDGTLREVGDLMELTISDRDGKEMKLSDWMNFRSISSIKENKVQGGGMMTTKRAGVLWGVDLTCEWTEDGLQADQEMRPTIGKEEEWTASQDFPLYKEPGVREEVCRVKKGDTVKLLSVTWKEDILYLECETSSGEKGWIQDRKQDEWEWTAEESYFEESRYL